MRSATVQRWSIDHFDPLLTLAALPIILLASAPSGHWSTAWVPVLAFAAWVPLTLRTRWPLPVAAVVVLVDSANIAVAAHGHSTHGIIAVATMLALYTVSLRSSARVAWASAAIAAAIQFGTSVLGLEHYEGNELLYVNWALVATVIGRLVRERQHSISAAEQRADEAERTKADEARRQVTEERLRIARELHDVLAHHITVVNAQAGVAQYLLRTNPDAAEEALAGITDNTRAALDDMRATLGLLRSDNDDTRAADREPAPALDQLPALIGSFTTGGAEVAVTTRGTPRPLSGPADLALYRIAQEALTNATKHATGSTVQVTLQWTDTAVTLEVVNTKPPTPAVRNTEGSGHGLIGMRERAISAGGTLTTGPTDSGGYAVTATLPVIADSAVAGRAVLRVQPGVIGGPA
jgi:signal transduction histidine kinase